MSYFCKILIGIDQLFNTLLFGSPDETLSSRLWRHRDSKVYGKFRLLVDFLFFWQSNHCYEAYLSEIYRKQYPKAYR